ITKQHSCRVSERNWKIRLLKRKSSSSNAKSELIGKEPWLKINSRACAWLAEFMDNDNRGYRWCELSYLSVKRHSSNCCVSLTSPTNMPSEICTLPPDKTYRFTL